MVGFVIRMIPRILCPRNFTPSPDGNRRFNKNTAGIIDEVLHFVLAGLRSSLASSEIN